MPVTSAFAIVAAALSAAALSLAAPSGERHVEAPPPTETIQVWQKQLAPGLDYFMEWDPATPRVIEALRVSVRAQNLRAVTELAGKTVYEATPSKGRATVAQIVADSGALAGVNGDFFPYTGDPLGEMVRGGEEVSSPFATKLDPASRRAALGWGAGVSALALPTQTIMVRGERPGALAVDGLDEDTGPDRIALDSPATGLAASEGTNAYLVLDAPEARWGPDAQIDATVASTGTNMTSLAVPPGGAILVAQGTAAAKLGGFRIGEHLSISMRTTGFDWSKIDEVIGGGPTLVRDGQVFVDFADERFKPDFANQRHPRTAAGRTKSGDLWLVVVDGRTAISAGATLVELGAIMRDLGCVDAINLDGGGSSTLNVLGLTVNHPSDGVERRVASAVLVSGERPVASTETLAISPVSPPAAAGEDFRLCVAATAGQKATIPNSAVVWAASGPAWIDQGGTLHVLGAGKALVRAWVHGQTLSAEYALKAKPKPKPARRSVRRRRAR